MSVKQNLIAAKLLIDTPEKWGQGEYAQDGCFCAIGALAEAMNIDPVSAKLSMTREFKTLRDSVPEPFYGVWRFNDDEATTHADIMALFDRAIEACDD
jgi:hypothetical protein